MKLIKQSFEILEQEDFTLIGIKKFIERCARVSYKSENRITDNSYEKFVNMLESRDHSRPLEFGTIHLKMDFHSYDVMTDTLVNKGILNQMWIKAVHKCDNVYVTTNYRYYLTIKEVYPDIERFFAEEDNKYYPKRYTVHFILSRGIIDEFRTHVGLSHLAESTRYCNYSKDKFNNEITYIKPSFLDMPEGSYSYWDGDWCDLNKMEILLPAKEYPSIDAFLWELQNSECQYTILLNQGCKPQEARDVLPLSIKSELISCGFEDAWENFFYRRCANDAHPMAREIAKPLQSKFIELGYVNQ